MRKPVLIISDTHYHNFKQYAQISADGVNTRLLDILRATGEAAAALKAAGGDTIVHCGDVFHVRGSLAPSVLNPVVDFYRGLIKDGFQVYMISGNHDLETDLAARVSSSVSALEGVGVTVINKPNLFIIDGITWFFVPWIKDLKDLRSKIKGIAVDNLVIHAPLNGVVSGIPDHGLNPMDFKDINVGNVFCGHYHNHRKFELASGACVYSVGALTHQNWGDVNSKAGYIILKDGAVEQHETGAPRFIKVDFEGLDTLGESQVTDNYVKVVGGEFTNPLEIQEVKDQLTLLGAKAVVVEGLTRKATATRALPSGTSAPTLESILGSYMDRTYPSEPNLKSLALDIINSVQDD